MPNDSSADENPVEALAAEFAERRRRGEHPSLEEYAAQHPELAEEIRAIFPALALVEELKPDSDDVTGGFTAAALGAGSPRERLGDFRILREVGRGGMGIVYEAEQESLGRRVALKVLGTSGLLDPRKVRRFRREARAAANLHHTHIVPVFGVGEDEGLHYYIMQFIPGLSLDDVLEELKRLRARRAGSGAEGAAECRGPGVSAADVAHSLWTGQLPPAVSAAPIEAVPRAEATSARDDGTTDSSSSVTLPGESDFSSVTDSTRRYFRSVARIGEQVAEALEYAHRQGTLHRDIKPSNLLLDAHGTVWVTDFGLAKAADGDEDLTYTGDIVGTVRYMAPERFRGQCDARADVYALGLILYELLAFRPAFPAGSREALICQITQEEPARLRRLDPTIPRDLETIVHKALEKDPAHRYATARQVAEDLRRFLEDRPIRARRVPASERFFRWSRRNKGLAASLAAVAVLLVIVAVGSTIAAGVYQAQRDEARRRAEELRWSNYVGLVSHAYFEVMENNLARAEELLDRCPTYLRGFEWHHVKRLCHLDAAALARLDRWVWCLAYAPDGSWIVSGEQGEGLSELVRRDPRSGAILREPLREDGTFDCLAVSPDGQYIACGASRQESDSEGRRQVGGRVIVVDAETWKVAWSREAPEGTRACDLAFSPDGSRLLVGYGPSVTPGDREPGRAELYEWTTDREPIAMAHSPGRGVTAVAISPVGRTVALATRARIELWDEDEEGRWTRRGPIEVPRDWIISLDFSPDGRLLASGQGDGAIRLWDVASRRQVRMLDDHVGRVNDVAFSPDGRLLASAGYDRSVRLWDVASGGRVGVLRGHANFVMAVDWHPDGRRLATAGFAGEIKLWDVRASHPIVMPHDDWQIALAFDPASPHGIIATQDPWASDRDAVYLWDPTSGVPVGVPLVEPPRPGLVTARPDDRPRSLFDSATCVVAFSRDGTLLASARQDDAVTVRERATGRAVLRLASPGEPITGIAFTSEGTALLTSGWKGTIARWNLVTGRRDWARTEHDRVAHLALSPDGRRLASSGQDGSLRLRDVGTGRVIDTPIRDPDLALLGCAFDATGTRLAVACRRQGVRSRLGGLIKLIDLVAGTIHTLEGHTFGVFDVAFSPDGRRLASAGDDRSIILWDPDRREPVFTLRGHAGGVTRVAFSPDGLLLASTGFDWTVRIWDARPLPAQGRSRPPASGPPVRDPAGLVRVDRPPTSK